MMEITIISNQLSNLCHIPGKVRFPFLQQLTLSWDDHWSILISSSIDSESMVDEQTFTDLIQAEWIDTKREICNSESLHVSSHIYDASLWYDFSSPPCCLLPVSRTQSCRESRFVWLTVKRSWMSWCPVLSSLYHNSSFGDSQFLHLSIPISSSSIRNGVMRRIWDHERS